MPLQLLSALFAVCSNVSFGASVVAMNAYLPSLARDSPKVIEAQKELDKSSKPCNTTLALPMSSIHLDANHALFTDPESVSISAPLFSDIPRNLSRLGRAGWWMLFSIPAVVWLLGVLAYVFGRDGDGDKWTVGAAWKHLGVMLCWSQVKQLQHTFRYLAVWFLFSDGMSTPCLCPPQQCARSPFTTSHPTPRCKFYHHHLDNDTFWQDDTTHGCLVAHADQHDHPHIWDPWLARVPRAAAAFCMVRSVRAHAPCVTRVVHSGVWVFGIHAICEAVTRGWVDNPRGDVWAGGVLW